jgi:hypothetical protein
LLQTKLHYVIHIYFLTGDAMQQCNFIIVQTKPLHCTPLWLEKIKLHVGMVAMRNNINLQAGLPTTRCALEAEWLRKNYDKCNAQIL